MGEVWRARDHDLQRDVAVKFLPEKFAADPNRFSRFAQEALAASRLTHPNIITIHEASETSGLHYIVMELVEGQTLRELLLAERERPLPVRRLLEIGSQIADGLAKAHAAGIVHRDLKPDNVMVTSDGFVKILDFGLVKLRGDGSGSQGQGFDSAAPTWPDSPTPQTAVGAVLGTAGYMSPEQARGRPVDHRSDQFTLGAILYEMATGRQAFRRETPAQTTAAIIDDAPEPLATLSPALPPPARWIIERCLAKDPGERYASTLDLARELRGLRERLGEFPTSGSVTSPSSGARAPGRRLRRAGVLALVVALVAGGAWLGRPAFDDLAVALGLLPLPAERRIAILPFRGLGPAADDKALAEGVVELLTARLSQVEAFQGALWVEPSSNVLRSGVTSADQAARALGVNLVVTGSVQRVQGRLVLTAALEDVRRSRTLRAATAEGPDGLVDAVVRMLQLELGAREERTLHASATGVVEAATLSAQAMGYTPYADGRTALERYDQSQGLERAIDLFQQALERDPRYAVAQAGLAEAYWRLYRATRRVEYVPLARQHAERAIALDDLNAAPWVVRGMIDAGTGSAETALAAFKSALDRNPRSADAHRELADTYERLGRTRDAQAAYAKAIELRPGYWANHNYLGAFLVSQGRYDEAEKAFAQALALAPDNASVWSNLGAARIRQGRPKEAEEALARSIELRPNASAFGNLGALQFSQGRYAAAARTLEQAVALPTRDYRVWRNLAAARYWAPGERDRAAEACRMATELGTEERKIDTRNPRLLVDLADCAAMTGERRAARGLLDEALALEGGDTTVARLAAGAYEQIGDRAAALRWLGVALRGGYPRDPIEKDPWLEALRADPGYRKLVTGVR
jgi:tetratricopeptide (TPR) repeat protein/TolB-like protein